MRARSAAFSRGDHDDPHRVLGAHVSTVARQEGHRAPRDAPGCDSRRGAARGWNAAWSSNAWSGGLFGAFIADATLPLRYRLRFHFAGGATWERGDPYRFLPTIGEVDLHLFNEGTHRQLWNVLGAHPREIDGERGVSFAVWAPNARSASVVGTARSLGRPAAPDAPARIVRRVRALHSRTSAPGTMYKYQLRTREGTAAHQDRSVRVRDGGAARNGIVRRRSRALRVDATTSG